MPYQRMTGWPQSFLLPGGIYPSVLVSGQAVSSLSQEPRQPLGASLSKRSVPGQAADLELQAAGCWNLNPEPTLATL